MYVMGDIQGTPSFTRLDTVWKSTEKNALDENVTICDYSEMTVIAVQTLREYSRRYPDASGPLTGWYKMMKNGHYNSLTELREDFPTADFIPPNRVCFNIKGNTYRLIVRVTWGVTVFIKDFVPHSEYSRKYRGGYG